MTLREASLSVSGGPVTIGSYYRTVIQARRNLRESLATVLIGIWLGVIKAEDVRRLFEIVASGSKELSEEEEDRLFQVLEALLDKMTM